MRILEDDMIEMDSTQYEQMYKSKIEFLRGQHLQQKRYQEEESVLDSTITECWFSVIDQTFVICPVQKTDIVL